MIYNYALKQQSEVWARNNQICIPVHGRVCDNSGSGVSNSEFGTNVLGNAAYRTHSFCIFVKTKRALRHRESFIFADLGGIGGLRVRVFCSSSRVIYDTMASYSWPTPSPVRKGLEVCS